MSADPLLAGGAASGGHKDLGGSEQQRRLAVLGIAACVLLVLATAVADVYATSALAVVSVGLVVVAWQRYILAWPTVLAYIVIVLLFVPIRRYMIGGGLPITLEPYRLLVALAISGWLLAVLVDSKVRWTKLGFDAPIIAFVVAAVASLALNIGWITGTGITGSVLKQASIFASFLLVVYFTASAIRTRSQLDRIVMLLVAGGVIVAMATVVEWRTSQNFFNNLDRYVPILRVDPSRPLSTDVRGGRVRAYASAEHPIALGAMLVLLLPLAIYLFRRKRQLIWLGAAALLVFGALASGSRTAAGMLAALLVSFFWIKRAETVKLLPMLVPLFVACQVVMPGTLGTFKAIIFPEGGSVIEEQKGGTGAGEGRVADLGPSLDQFAQKPFLGQGFGSRLTSQSDPVVNARILDNQWLGTLLEVGVFGAFALLWLYVRAVRMLARRARNDGTPHGWLLATLAASLTAYAAGMLTYDAFSFIQVTFISFILLGLAAAAIRLSDAEAAERA